MFLHVLHKSKERSFWMQRYIIISIQPKIIMYFLHLLSYYTILWNRIDFILSIDNRITLNFILICNSIQYFIR